MSKDYIIEQLKKQIENFETSTQTEKVGTVIEVGDGVAKISGLSDVMASEMIEFPGGIFGVVLNLEEGQIGAMILGAYEKIKEGDTVKSTGKIFSVPWEKIMIGRVVSPLGEALTEKERSKAKNFIRWKKSRQA